MDQVAFARLQLAARTLVEWRTPPESDDYKRVLAELLAMYLKAARVGPRFSAQILKLDRDNVVPWYLSETLSTDSLQSNASRPKRGRKGSVTATDLAEPLQPSRNILNCSTLLDSAIVVLEKLDHVWPTGPHGAKVASVLAIRLSAQDDEDVTIACRALLALVVPFDGESRRRYLQALMIGVPTLRFRQLLRLLRLIQKAVHVGVLLLSGLALYFAYTFGVAFHSVYRIKLAVVLARVAVVILSIVAIPFLYDRARRRVSTWTARKFAEIQGLPPGDFVAAVLSGICMRDLDVFSVVCRDPRWLAVIVGQVSSMSEPMARKVLEVIRWPETSALHREKLFNWLLSVEFRE